jgi:hypothetical protein
MRDYETEEEDDYTRKEEGSECFHAFLVASARQVCNQLI